MWSWDNDWIQTYWDLAKPHSLLTKRGRAAWGQVVESGVQTAKEDWGGIKALASPIQTTKGSYHMAKEAGARNLKLSEAVNEPGTSDWIVAKDAILFNTLDVVPGVSSAQLFIPVHKDGTDLRARPKLT